MDDEQAQVAYTGTEYGFRHYDGAEIRPAQIGPREAANHLARGAVVYERQKTVYVPTVTEWVEMQPPSFDPAASIALDYGAGFAAGREAAEAELHKAWDAGFAEGAIAARGLDALDNPYRD